ncbi:DUF3017 domain-containing protein [Nocardioides sp. WS12]|uniref:DUF3017 domain-containing protein n=1 Tax=Nocardioides sp. WS12 TaxID=2486272 RepID=UPI0031F838C6
MGVAQPGWCRSDDPRDAARQRGHHGRAGRRRRPEGSTLNDDLDGASAVPVNPEPLPIGERAPRRLAPATIGGFCYLAILVGTLAGVVVAATTDWRLGIRIISGVLGAAAVLRLALPEKDAGMLAIRHRFLDVAILLAIGITLFALAQTIPNQPV